MAVTVSQYCDLLKYCALGYAVKTQEGNKYGPAAAQPHPVGEIVSNQCADVDAWYFHFSRGLIFLVSAPNARTWEHSLGSVADLVCACGPPLTEVIPRAQVVVVVVVAVAYGRAREGGVRAAKRIKRVTLGRGGKQRAVWNPGKSNASVVWLRRASSYRAANVERTRAILRQRRVTHGLNQHAGPP